MLLQLLVALCHVGSVWGDKLTSMISDRLTEAETLVHLSDMVIGRLPASSPAKDEVSIFRAKLTTLLSVAGEMDTTEWDETIAALFAAEHFGVKGLSRLLDLHIKSEARFSVDGEECDGAETANAQGDADESRGVNNGGRRLHSLEVLQSSIERPYVEVETTSHKTRCNGCSDPNTSPARSWVGDVMYRVWERIPSWSGLADSSNHWSAFLDRFECVVES